MKRMTLKATGIICLLLTTLVLHAQSPSGLIGKWEGSLEVPNAKLRLMISLTEKEAIMYSVDQGNATIKINSVELDGNSFKMTIPMIAAEYKGELTDDETMSGTFTQPGAAFPLTLKRAEKVQIKLEPDEYETEFYTSRNVTFKNGDITLGGTLTTPKGKKNYPTAVLVTGSGLQNRDSEIFGHKPFSRLADFLSSNGIAILRYDDRGVSKSTGDPVNATTDDFLTDALAAVEYIRSLSGSNKSMVGIVGHSEGGLIAMMAAAENKLDYMVSLAGSTLTGEEVVILQSRKLLEALGAPKEQIDMTSKLNKDIFNIVKAQPDNTLAKQEIESFMEQFENPSIKQTLTNQMTSLLSPAFRRFLVIDPADYLHRIKCPALLMFGEKDLQVPAKEDIERFHQLMSNKTPKNFSIQIVSGVNHLFQDARKGTIDEYSNPDNVTMNDKTLKVLLEWFNKSIK